MMYLRKKRKRVVKHIKHYKIYLLVNCHDKNNSYTKLIHSINIVIILVLRLSKICSVVKLFLNIFLNIYMYLLV